MFELQPHRCADTINHTDLQSGGKIYLPAMSAGLDPQNSGLA